MKDNRFIELVNLYIDRQITTAEATELEAEMQENPRRRAIYRQYCQMHRATTLVYESFRNHAAGQQTDIAVDRANITHIGNRNRSRRVRWTYYAGGLAAACLALALVRLSSPGTVSSGLAAVPKPASPAAVVAVQPVAALVSQVDLAGKTRLDSLRNGSLAGTEDYSALLAALRREEQRALANGQLEPGRLPSLFDDGVFESPQVSSANNQRIFRVSQTPAQQAEFTAFQFQR